MPDDRAIAHTHARKNRITAIRAGALPSNSELLSGLPFLRGSAELDCQAWIDVELQRLDTIGNDVPELRKALAALRVKFGAASLHRLTKANAGQMDIEERALIYIGAIEPFLPERSRVAAMAMSRIRVSSLDSPFYLATALGLMSSRKEDFDECRTEGFKVVDNLFEVLKRLREAAQVPDPRVTDLDDDEHEAFIQTVLEDRAEFFGSGTINDPLRIREKAQRPGDVVLPAFADAPTTGRDDRGRVRREFAGIAGKRLPFVLTGDVSAHMRALVDRAPHLRELFESMLTDTAMSTHVRLRPWLLVGDSGSGKSWAAREFADVMGLPVLIFDAGGSSDGAFAGTPAQWSSAGASHVMQLINSSGIANPLVVVDEVDKAANSPANGGLHSALLSFLDPGNAAGIHDPGLETKVDLSHVNYVLTANDLSRVPAPLRDRCRIVRVPDPGFEHVPTLVRRIVDDLARQRGMDPRWEPPLPPDEVENIAHAWGGGSIRKLRQVVQSALEFRSQNQWRC